MKKILLILIALTTLLTLLVGCSSSNSDDENFFSEGIRKAGDKITNFFGGNSLTEDKSLEGV